MIGQLHIYYFPIGEWLWRKHWRVRREKNAFSSEYK